MRRATPRPRPLAVAGCSTPLALGAEVVASLRPRTLAEFVGQSELKRRLAVILEAARRRGQPPDHFLFAGPPGLGKTSLSVIVAAEMDVALHVTSGPALERPGDLAAILTKLGDGDVLFIDEIHRLSRSVEEVLYPAMEDFQLDIVLGKGPAARSIRLDLPRFCLVGATTRTGLITGPLRDRFGLVARLDYYEPDDLRAIVERAAVILGASVDAEGARVIARRSRGTPRIANRLLRRVRDVAEVEGDGVIDAAVAASGLELFGIDALGLDKLDRAILSGLCERFGGGPGRAVDARDRGLGADRDRRGRLRAVPDPAGPADAHPSGPGRDRGSLAPPGTGRSAVGLRHLVAGAVRLSAGPGPTLGCRRGRESPS